MERLRYVITDEYGNSLFVSESGYEFLLEENIDGEGLDVFWPLTPAYDKAALSWDEMADRFVIA